MATSAQPADVPIVSIRGGINDTDPLHAIGEDQCEVADNVELFNSTLGERRFGLTAVDLSASALSSSALCVHLSQWFPAGNPVDPEWFAITASPGTSTNVARYRTTAWTPTTPNDAISTVSPDIYHIQSQPLGQLLFIAYRSSVDRLHCWDGTNWRRTGVAQPAPPTAADSGIGTYASTRYFRTRYVELNGASQVVRRSEPSTTLTFTPAGTGAGVFVTRGAALSEGETHWELEASTDGVNFYRIATIIIATTSYAETTAFASGYANQGSLSEVIGTYLLQNSAKFLAVDGDRLLYGGHWTDLSKQSTVSWTPVHADPGAGNSERLPLQFNNTIDLDGYDGGALTGMSGAVYGTWYAFKWQRIYQMTRTGDANRAYDMLMLSATRGAVPGTIVHGADEHGSPCIYFLDPVYGPSRIGAMGIQAILGLRNTWNTVNLLADVVGHGVFYPYKQQVHWWISTNGASTPNKKIVLQVSEMSSTVGAASRGWTTASGRITNAYTSAVLTEQIFINGTQYLSYRPYIGTGGSTYIGRCDTGTKDDGADFVARVITRPYAIAGVLNKWGTMASSLLTAARSSQILNFRWIRDFGVETGPTITASLTPVGSEDLVVKLLDNLAMSNAAYLQLEYFDSGAA